jgi:hypothetical protein
MFTGRSLHLKTRSSLSEQDTRLTNDWLKAGWDASRSVFQYRPSTTPPLAIRTPVENGAADDVDDVVVGDADDSVEEVASTVEDAVS